MKTHHKKTHLFDEKAVKTQTPSSLPIDVSKKYEVKTKNTKTIIHDLQSKQKDSIKEFKENIFPVSISLYYFKGKETDKIRTGHIALYIDYAKPGPHGKLIKCHSKYLSFLGGNKKKTSVEFIDAGQALKHDLDKFGSPIIIPLSNLNITPDDVKHLDKYEKINPSTQEYIAKIEKAVHAFLKRSPNDYKTLSNNCADAVIAFLIAAGLVPSNTATWGIVRPYYTAECATARVKNQLDDLRKDILADIKKTSTEIKLPTTPYETVIHMKQLIDNDINRIKINIDLETKERDDLVYQLNSISRTIDDIPESKSFAKFEMLLNQFITVSDITQPVDAITAKHLLECKSLFPYYVLPNLNKKIEFLKETILSLEKNPNDIPQKYVSNLKAIVSDYKPGSEVKTHDIFLKVHNELERKLVKWKKDHFSGIPSSVQQYYQDMLKHATDLLDKEPERSHRQNALRTARKY